MAPGGEARGQGSSAGVGNTTRASVVGPTMTVPLSILDLAPIAPGETARDSFAASVALAQQAERSGYRRVWYAEHHNMASIASSATSVLIAHVASQTSTHPPRLRRRHAAEPLAAHDRRAVRHPRDAAPGPHRPRSRPRPRQRPGHVPRAAPRPGLVRAVPAGRPRAAGVPRRAVARPRRLGHARRRHGRAALHPRLVALRRPARRRPRPALRLRLALRARRAARRRGRSTAASSSRRRSSTSPTSSPGSTPSPPTTPTTPTTSSPA